MTYGSEANINLLKNRTGWYMFGYLHHVNSSIYMDKEKIAGEKKYHYFVFSSLLIPLFYLILNKLQDVQRND